MKAKKHSRHPQRNRFRDEMLPHELGAHLFAMIRRNLSRQPKVQPVRHVQLTFAFQAN